MKTGIILKNGDVEKSEGPNQQGYIYQDIEAFDKKEGICYIPEYGSDNINENKDTIYSYNDFLKLAGGNPRVAKFIFESVDWQFPETYLEESLEDIFIKCSNCGYISFGDETVCAKCGGKL